MPTQFFSLDRRGFYKTGGTLGLYQQNPLPSRPYMHVEPQITPAIVDSHLLALYPSDLSLHGWDYMTQLCLMPPPNAGTANYSAVLELVLEYARRAAFMHRPSRLQSYFAFDSLAEVKIFRASCGSPHMPIYLLDPSQAIQLDQYWLRLGHQNAIGTYCVDQYWSGAASADPKWEHVLVPPIHVVKQVA